MVKLASLVRSVTGRYALYLSFFALLAGAAQVLLMLSVAAGAERELAPLGWVLLALVVLGLTAAMPSSGVRSRATTLASLLLLTVIAQLLVRGNAAGAGILIGAALVALVAAHPALHVQSSNRKRELVLSAAILVTAVGVSLILLISNLLLLGMVSAG